MQKTCMAQEAQLSSTIASLLICERFVNLHFHFSFFRFSVTATLGFLSFGALFCAKLSSPNDALRFSRCL